MKESVADQIKDHESRISKIERKIKTADFAYGGIYVDILNWCEERNILIAEVQLMEVLIGNANN